MVWQSNVLPPSSGKSVSYSILWCELCIPLRTSSALSIWEMCCWSSSLIQLLIVGMTSRTEPLLLPQLWLSPLQIAADAQCVDIAAFLTYGELCVETVLLCWTNWCQPFTSILLYCALPVELRHAVVLLYGRVSFFRNNLDWKTIIDIGILS